MSVQPSNASNVLPNPLKVRVVIPCRNEAGYIGRCLRSLIDTDRIGMQVEAWVCDGMSDDGTREEIEALAALHPWIKLIDNTARTTPQAMNLGLRPGGYDVGILLGAHAEVETDFLRANLDCLAAHPGAFDEHRQIGARLRLTDELAQHLRAERAVGILGQPLTAQVGVRLAHFGASTFNAARIRMAVSASGSFPETVATACAASPWP